MTVPGSTGVPVVSELTVVFGVPVDDVTMHEVIDYVGAFVEHGRATSATHQIATVNADFVTHALLDEEVRRILQRVDLATPDGVPIMWAAKLFGTPARGRVAGADLVPALAVEAARQGWRMLLFGAGPGVAEAAAEVLRKANPGLWIVGVGDDILQDVHDTDPCVLERIRAAAPDIVCVALGHPKQERWIDVHREALGAPVCIGVGATLDYLVGEKRRAPMWMRRSGLEWVHRACTEPGRLGRRYARDIRWYFPSLLRARRVFGPVRSRSGSIDVSVIEGEVRLRVRGAFALAKDAAACAAIAAAPVGSSVVVDLDDLARVDHEAAASVLLFARLARAAGARPVLGACSAATADALARSGVADAFDPPEPVSLRADLHR